MKAKCRQRSAWAVLALLVVAAPALAGGDRAVNAGPVDLAAVKVFGGGVDLAPNVRYERAIVTVSGVGTTYRLEFDKHARLSISPFAPSGDLLADGTYGWELQLVPGETAARKLRESASANGGEPLRPWLPKSGSFSVRGGIIASPDVVEAGARERAERNTEAPGGNRREVAARAQSGQMFGAEKAARGPAMDSDDMAGAGESELSLLKASRSASPQARRAAERPSEQTGPDSDRQAAAIGATAERALVAVPKAHEINLPNPRPRSDGANGRPRSDR